MEIDMIPQHSDNISLNLQSTENSSFKLELSCQETVHVNEMHMNKDTNSSSDQRHYSKSLFNGSIKDLNIDNKLDLGNGHYACEPCGVPFKTELRLANHMRCHNEKQFGCFICNRFFSSKKNLKIHLSSKLHTPTSKKNFHCGHCQKRFSNKFSFQRHKMKHLMSGCVVKCDRPNCFKRFLRVSDLLLHQKMHKKKQKCDKCCRLISEQNFEKHRCLLPFVCQCKTAFATRQELVNHAKSHETETLAVNSSSLPSNNTQQVQNGKTIVCDVCFKRFKKISDLRNHKVQTHSSQFDCFLCDAKFNRKMDLIMHNKIHQKSLSCSDCGKLFTRSHCLKRHMEVCIGSGKLDLVLHQKLHQSSFPCQYCGRIFKRSYNLQRHILIHGNDALQCPLCKRLFCSHDSLEKHKVYSHSSHKCSECEKSFNKIQDLVLHSKCHKIMQHTLDDSPGLLGYLL